MVAGGSGGTPPTMWPTSPASGPLGLLRLRPGPLLSASLPLWPGPTQMQMFRRFSPGPVALSVPPLAAHSPPADETAGPAVANLAIQQLYRAGQAYFGRGQFSAAARMFRLILDHFEGFPCEVLGFFCGAVRL